MDRTLHLARADPSYRGHRRDSFVPLDQAETVELRARFRTFHGAYTRTALLNLGFAAVILKIFDKRFYAIGLLYAVLSLAILLVAFSRSSRSDRDFSDEAAQGVRWDGPASGAGEVDEDVVRSRDTSRAPDEGVRKDGTGKSKRRGKGKEPEPPKARRFGRPFRTSGVEVAIVSGLVLATQAALLGLLMTL